MNATIDIPPGKPPAAPFVDPVVLRSTSAVDIDEHTEQLQDWNLRYDQLDCGSFEGRFIDIRWPGVQLFMEKTTRRVRQRGHLMADSCGFATLLEGDGPVTLNGVQAGFGTLIACDSTELDACTPADCTLAGCVIDAALLHEQLERMPELRTTLRPGVMLSMKPPESAMNAWRTLLTNTVHAVTTGQADLALSAVRGNIRDELVGGLVHAISLATHDGDELTPGVEQRKRIVDRACELFLSQPDEPLSLFEVCHRVGASPRKLGYCFQDVLGVSPARYVKSIRLNAVRRELARGAQPSQSVYDVAARWGFWHFGHFSADYKKQFAELPSETRRRSLARLGH